MILYTGQTKDEACAKEIELIAQWNLTDPACGYNISKGGDGLDSDIVANQWKNLDFKEKASACMREAWKDPEKRQRRSEAATTRWANEEFKKKAVTAVTEACARPVVCIETGIEYATIKEAAQAIGVSDKNAQRAIKKGYRWGGFHWNYIDDIS